MGRGSKIKALRLSAGMSQNALARKANLDRATVAAAENGKGVNDLSLSKIAVALGVDTDEIDVGS